MKSQEHLILNTIIILPILYFIYSKTIFQLNFFHLFLAIYLFSNLPDIDNSKSKITKTFFFFYLILALFGVSNIIIYTFESILLGISQIIIACCLGIYHFFVAENSKKHRKFPHTFTFGLITSIIFGFFTSLQMALIAFLCFFLHIFFDNHLIQAIKTDLKNWKKLFFFF